MKHINKIIKRKNLFFRFFKRFPIDFIRLQPEFIRKKIIFIGRVDIDVTLGCLMSTEY